MTGPRPAELKTFGACSIKNAEKGEVEAIVATLGVVDRDRDIIRTGAVANGTKVIVSEWAHDAVTKGTRPIGRGTLVTEGDQLVFRGRLFLATAAGRETFAVLKEMETDQQWSFGYRVIDDAPPSAQERQQGALRILAKLEAIEVSPVLVGAGIGTQTVAVKDADDAEQQAELAAIRAKVIADIARREAGEQQDELRAIAAKHARAITEQAGAAMDAEKKALVRQVEATLANGNQILLESYARKWANGSRDVLYLLSTPLLGERPELAPLLEFAMREFAIPSDRAPTVCVVPQKALADGDGIVNGCYYPSTASIYIAKELAPEQMARTILHEYAHHYEKLKGWPGSEEFASNTSDELYAKWRQERKAA